MAATTAINEDSTPGFQNLKESFLRLTMHILLWVKILLTYLRICWRSQRSTIWPQDLHRINVGYAWLDADIGTDEAWL